MQRRRKQIFTPTLTFQVFYKIFSQRKLGIIATYITLTISFLQLIIFVFQAFLSLTITENDFPAFVNLATSYAYMMNLMDLSPSIYFAIRTVVFILTIIYFLLFLAMRWTTAHSKTIKGLEKLFDLMNSYYTALILLPTTEMAFREIFCDDDVMVPLEQVCGQGSHIAILFFAVISFLLAVIMSVITVMYSLNGIYDKKNYFSGENRFYDGIVVATKIITAIIISIGATSEAFLLIYLGANLILSVILLLCFLFWYPYNKVATEYFALMWLSVYFIESLAFTVYVIIGDDALTSGYILVMLLISAVPALFYLYVKLKMRVVNKDHTSSTNEFLMKVQHLLQLKQGEKISTFEEVQFRGIIARHMQKCVLKKCFCKETELFDPKKNRYIELEQWHSNKSLILKYYVRHLFEEAVKLDPLHPDLLISYSEFLFEKFRNTHLALYQIMKIAQSNKFLHPYHRFKIYKLKQKISDYINSRNTEALEKTLEIESVIFVEEQLNKVMSGMKEIVTNSLNFWSYLVNKDLDLNKLSGLVQKMHNSVENTEMLWNPLKKYLRKQKKLMYFYNWFLKDFLHKRILLSEEEIDELFDNETFSVYSNDFIHILRDDNIIFQEDSAIIHMSGNNNDLGKIIKTNRTASKLFKYTKEELEKSHVNVLMPKLIADRHNSYLESYIYTGKTQVMYNQRKTFAKDKQGFIIPIWIIVKQLDNPDGMIQYVGLLRPLAQKKDEQSYYILMNNFGEISGISKNLTEHLKLPGDIFQKNMINAVLLAPKLIKYLYFAKLLHDEREKKVNESEEIDHFLISRESEAKKESKLHHIIRRSDKSPFMASSNKVSALKDFLELDNLKIDGLGTTTRLDGDKSPRGEDDAITERNFNQDYENKEIEFTFRLPQRLNKYLKEFQVLKAKKHGLLNNQQMLINAVESKDLLKEALKRSDSTGGKPTLIFKKKAAFHLASYKHAVDSYVEALRTVSNQIARSNNNNVYRIKGVIVTDQYGPENDIIKYIKIVEITKKVEKFSEYQLFNSERTMPMTPKDERRDSSSMTFFSSQSERIGSLKTRLYTSNMKTIRPSTFKTAKDPDDGKPNEDAPNSDDDIPKENSNGVSPPNENADELESPMSMQSKRRHSQRSEKSSKKEDEDDAKSNKSREESDRQGVMNELKNNLLAPFQSIYQKEDNLQINNHFRSLNNVKWFIRILFLTVIPLNICLYFIGPNVTFNKLDKSVSDIFLNEDLRKDYIRAHDAMITLLMDNAGLFDTLRATRPTRVDALIANSFSTLNDSYSNVFTGNSMNEWTSVLYDYIPRVKDVTSVNYEGPFSSLVIDAENALQKLTNSLSEIVQYTDSQFVGDDEEIVFYRANSLEKFNYFLTNVTSEIFKSLQDNFDSTEKLSTFILISEGVIFFLSFFGILRLIITVIRSLKEILRTFTAIENDYLRETQKYYHRLQDFLEAAKSQYISSDIESDLFKRSTRDVNSKLGDNTETRYQKKLKNIDDKSFMKKDSIKILAYYVFFVILSCILAVILHIQTLNSLDTLQKALVDGQTFLMLNPSYIVSLIGLKELFYNRGFYKEFDLPFMDTSLQQLKNTLDRSLFKSGLGFVDFMNEFLNGTPCDTFRDILTADQYQDCKTMGIKDTGIWNGLNRFHNYYGDYIMDTLTLQTDSSFGEVTIDVVYTAGQVIHIIDGVFMEKTLAMWRDDMKNYLRSKERLLIILVVAVSVLNILVFAGAEKGVVGTLNAKFLLYRKIFNKYMLGEALVREKKIKSRLVKLKLLNN